MDLGQLTRLRSHVTSAPSPELRKGSSSSSPRCAYRPIDLRGDVSTGIHDGPQFHLPYDDITVRTGGSAPQAQTWHMAVPFAVDAVTRVLGDLEPQHRPRA